MYFLQGPLLVFSVCVLLTSVTARPSHRDINSALKHKRLTHADSSPSLQLRGDDPSELRKRDGTKYVFMHHIVGNTYPYTQADWADDIQQMHAKGVDAIVLNIGYDDWQPAQCTSAFAAAQASGTGVKLFLSYDFTALPCNPDIVVHWVDQFKDHPNHFLVNGRPMISSFMGSCLSNDQWGSIKAQTNGYLMPFIPGLENNFGNWMNLDSWFCWGCAWPNGNYDKNTDDDNYYMQQLGSRYATTVSGWMFAHMGYKNLYQRGDDWLINNRWEQLVSMRDQLTFVEMPTWNDFGESDYFGPIKGAQPAGTTWATGFPHIAWFDMSAYYITAFKTGNYPPITQDVIYYWSRPHPAGATASNDPLPKPSGWDWADDYLWAAVFATNSATVTLQLGSSSQTFNVGSGVSKLKIPTAPGQITVTMVRNGQTIINQSPTDFTFVNNPTLYNYNAYVGSATANGANLPPPPPPPTTTATATATTSPTAAATQATPTPTKPISKMTLWTNAGCYVDNAQRILRGSFTDQVGMTVEKCASICATQSYLYAGVEYGTQCLCGSQLFQGNGAGVHAAASDCNMACSGNSGETCGGGWRANLYARPGAPTLPT